jgi:RNA polymerase sigma-70 factor (ECF subfamily)
MSVTETAFTQDDALIGALCNGDERAFAFLLDRYHASMVRVATLYVQDKAIAEEITQETWLAVLKGIRQFQGRSSLKTWIFSILTNQARTRGRRESRSVPFSALYHAEESDETSYEPAVDPARFKDDGWWRDDRHPHEWSTTPEGQYLRSEVRACAQGAIDALPPVQRQVITLRDVEGLASEDVCSILGISETNQRVLLHRARSKVRRALEQYFDE